MSPDYESGKSAALRALGLTPPQQDNPVLEKFVQGLPDVPRKGETKTQGNRPLHRQTWGKPQHYTTSEQNFQGGGVRL